MKSDTSYTISVNLQDTILELLSEAMVKKNDAKGFLIDGFPRDVPQGEKFENEVCFLKVRQT